MSQRGQGSDQGKVAIVTGASAGIGLAVTRQLVARGITVVMVARTRSTLESAAAKVGSGAVPWPLDVGDLSALAALPDAVVARFGRLDIVVNNAGAHHRGPVESVTPEQLAEMVHVNLSAPIVLTRAALPHLKPGASIIDVASLAGRVPFPNAATYSASKVGLRYFSASLAEERPDLRVCLVSPGPVDTGFFGDLEKVSPMVFSQPMVSADQVAERVLACLEGDSREIAIPRASGWLTTLGSLLPWLRRALTPMLKRKGERAKAAYILRKQRERDAGA